MKYLKPLLQKKTLLDSTILIISILFVEITPLCYFFSRFQNHQILELFFPFLSIVLKKNFICLLDFCFSTFLFKSEFKVNLQPYKIVPDI